MSCFHDELYSVRPVSNDSIVLCGQCGAIRFLDAIGNVWFTPDYFRKHCIAEDEPDEPDENAILADALATMCENSNRIVKALEGIEQRLESWDNGGSLDIVQRPRGE